MDAQRKEMKLIEYHQACRLQHLHNPGWRCCECGTIITREVGDMGLRIREWTNERGGKDMFYSPDGTVWFPTRDAANQVLEQEKSEEPETIISPMNKDRYYGCTFCGTWTSTGYETERKDWSCEGCAVSLNGTWLYQYGYVRFDSIKVVGDGKAKGLLSKYKIHDENGKSRSFYDYAGSQYDGLDDDGFYLGYNTNRGYNTYNNQKREVEHKMNREYTVGKGIKDAK